MEPKDQKIIELEKKGKKLISLIKSESKIWAKTEVKRLTQIYKDNPYYTIHQSNNNLGRGTAHDEWYLGADFSNHLDSRGDFINSIQQQAEISYLKLIRIIAEKVEATGIVKYKINVSLEGGKIYFILRDSNSDNEIRLVIMLRKIDVYHIEFYSLFNKI